MRDSRFRHYLWAGPEQSRCPMHTFRIGVGRQLHDARHPGSAVLQKHRPEQGAEVQEQAQSSHVKLRGSLGDQGMLQEACATIVPIIRGAASGGRPWPWLATSMSHVYGASCESWAPLPVPQSWQLHSQALGRLMLLAAKTGPCTIVHGPCSGPACLTDQAKSRMLTRLQNWCQV